MSTVDKLCSTCQERFSVEGERHCGNCLMFVEEIDERDCPACGSALDWTGACLCDLGPDGDSSYWVRVR
jgi:predicted amidophosphoribosyltransferase